MIKVYYETTFENFKAWSGGEDTLDALTSDEKEELEKIFEEEYPEGINETELNDLLRLERDWIASLLGYIDWEDLENHKEERGM